MSDTYKDHGHPPGWENEHDPRCQACAESELASSAGSGDCLASRWTEQQKERARNIVNDIAEDIDNGESREVLREALAIYADFLWDSHRFKEDTLLEKTLVALQALKRTQSQNIAMSHERSELAP